MKKEAKQIVLVLLFLLLGCVVGYFAAITQAEKLRDPAIMALWEVQNMPVPEPITVPRSVISFGLLFSGIPTGLFFYRHIAASWLTPMAPKIIIGMIAFPVYALIGAIGSIPFMVYKGIFLLKGKRQNGR